MKKTKKLIAVVLAMVMMLSVASVAFAGAECEHEFNTETLVRPVDGKDGEYVCKKCAQNVSVKSGDFKEFIAVYAKITGISSNFYVDDETENDLENYFQEILYKVMVVAMESIDEEIYGNVNFTQLTECEQDIIDLMTAALQEVLKLLKDYVDEKGYEPFIDGSEYIEKATVLDIYDSYFGVDFDEYLNTFPEEKKENIHKLKEEASEMLGSIDYENLEEITDEDKAIIKGALAKITYIYENVAECFIGEHKAESTEDCGDGKHISYCSFCGSAFGEEEHIWGEYTANGDAHCTYEGTKTATCTKCTATNTIAGECDGKKHINEDGDDFCDRCGERVVERCSFCDEVAHEGYLKYVCMLRTLIKLIVNLFKTVNN